ncbi:PREDICTED: jerky protein homolog-like [Dufourea novaeangliae]|uniref:jerky protein homolog-like n=1 Tax=Dufourea novaeangliae TaxID=178035 RepID=UPI0007672715|nr:PREDICTED: jerky protein homolog-like [Dufourea novaeangliae]
MWMRENTRKLINEDVDVRLYSWYLEQKSLGTTITDSILWEKAVQLQKELGGPTASRGWLTNFKERHGVSLGSIDEAGNTNFCSGVYITEEVCLKEEVVLEEGDPLVDDDVFTEVNPEQFLKTLTDRLRLEGITPKNIYYMKDTTLAWKAFPAKLLEQCKRRKSNAAKFKKDRVTVSLCVNVSGCHKLESLFIYRLENPKALKHCRDRLPVLFKCQEEARMDHTIFLDWYENHFKPTVKILQFPDSSGKIVLLLDDDQRDSLRIPNDFGQNDDIHVIFFPASVASLLQPLEQEVAEKTKRSYRLKMLQRVLNFPGGVRKFYFDYDLKDCIDLFTEAWMEVNVANIQAAWNKIINNIPEVCPIKEEPVDPLEPNFHDIIGVICGDQEPEESVNEFLSRCEEVEKNFMTHDEETDTDDENEEEDEEDYGVEGAVEFYSESEVPTEQIMRRAFETLLRWSKLQPQFIQLQVEYLKNYYESTIRNK